MVACRKKTTAGWAGTPTVMMVSTSVRQHGLQRRTSKTHWPGREFAKLDVGVPVLVEALRKRGGLNSISRRSRLAPAAISSLRSPLPMLLLPSKLASCLRYVATAAYTRIQAHACRIAAFTAAGSSFRRSVGLPGRDARAPRRQADSAD